MSLDEHNPPPPYQPAVQTPPQPQQGTSGLAVTGFILAILLAPIGFILSLIAVFKTGAGRRKGRGLAIAGLVISVLIIGIGVTAGLLIANSTVADPGCTAGKSAILNSSDGTDAKSLQTTIDSLNAAAAKAKHDDVRAATKALANDYTQLLNATKTGNVPANLESTINSDAAKFDSLCTIGG